MLSLVKDNTRILLKSQRLSDVVLLLLWLIALMAVSPFGEFPINDDWAYAKNVKHLALEGRFVVDTFPAMNLVSQTVYGSFFAWLFGFSFVTLRMSIFFLCILSSLVLKKTVEMLTGNQSWFSLFFVVTFFFNPVMLELSFTFMTDMFFISMVIFSIYFLFTYLRSDRIVHYAWFVFFCVVAVLCRQQGLLISGLALILLAVDKGKKYRLILALLPALLTWLAHDKYRHYLAENHIANGINYTDKLIKHLMDAPVGKYIAQTADSVIVTGLFLLPLVLVLSTLPQFRNMKMWLIGAPIFVVVVYLVYFMRELYPVGNISLVLQCGPRLVKVESGEQYSFFLEAVRTIQVFVGGISFSVVLITLCVRKSGLAQVHKLLPLLFGVVASIYFIFIALSEAYFDRYNIPLILLFAMMLLPAQPFSFNKVMGFSAIVLGALLFVISVVEVSDFFRWQKTRWEALNTLNSQGVSATRIDGGFEYNAWHKPSEKISGMGKSWWWVKDDEFVVSKQRLKKYSVEKVYSVTRLLPYGTDSIYVLKRASDN